MKCKFTDIRNCWEMNEAPKIDGTWYDIQNELIKQAAKCEFHNADVVIDIKGIDSMVKKGEPFECHEIFYKCGVHSTLEYNNEWLETKKLNEMLKHCSDVFCVFWIKFTKVSDRDFELDCLETTNRER